MFLTSYFRSRKQAISSKIVKIYIKSIYKCFRGKNVRKRNRVLGGGGLAV